MSLVSCGVVTPKNYPPNKPFVYKTVVNLEGKFKRDEKNDIRSRLDGQLDDSIRVRTVQKFIFWHILRKPPIYDSTNADKSVIFMRALLNSLGYFRDTITYDTTLQIVNNDQYRTTVNFHVRPGKVTRLDSLSWNINHPKLKSLTDSAISETFLKKGEPFAQPVISAELNRLVDLYRNNGYLRFSRDEMIGVWDTVDASLLRPTLDPLEQIQQLQELQKRRENPTADLEIRLKPNLDSSKLVKFYVGKVTVYPDYNRDTAVYLKKEKLVDFLRVIYFRNYFKPRLLPENISFRYGDVYSQNKYIATINRFNSLGAWRLVGIEQIPRINSDTVDFVIRLTPADKYSFTANVEGSFNNTFFSGNLFGVGLNFGLQNRNFAKGSNQANTNFRFGTELNVSQGDNFVQTKTVSFGHTIYFPRIIPRFKFLSPKFKENFRSIFSFNVANTDRIDLFNLTTFNLSWGYEKTWKNKLIGLRIPNVEYVFLTQRDSLKRLIKNNPALGYIFNQGLVISFVPSYTVTWPRKNTITSLHLNLEHSGLLAGLIRTPFFDSNLYRFVKIDADLRKIIKINNTEFAFRIFGGTGYCFYDAARNLNKNQSLPFFKQYFGGGPNSMRGWALRRLGPGSTVKPFKDDPLRFGDIQLELNGEYRFYLMNIAGVKFHSALYSDVGNVWFLRKIDGYPDGTFQFKNLLKELAVDVGTGLRIDFSYFILRLDYAFKVRDPSPEPANILSQYKWFYGWNLKTLVQGQLQLGINYPF